MRRLLLFAILFLSPSLITAQVVRGKLTVAGGTPVAGAIVTLVDSSGTVIGRVLSTPLGGYALSTGLPGDYSLRVLRVGFPAWKSRPFALRPGAPTDFSAELPEDAIVLSEIAVAGNGACQVGADEGSTTATLLEEVGKALGSAELALRDREFAFQMVRFVRQKKDAGLLLKTDSVLQLMYNWPIRSLDATKLTTGGFVQRASEAGLELSLSGEGDYYYWFGPDATTLLAPTFLNTHCFRVTEDRRDSTRIGLAFAPARGRRTPDIAGTLWVDRGTLATRSLSYEYVNVPAGFPRKGAGGEIAFLRLPNGLWLVSRWSIRAPMEGLMGGAPVWVEDGGYIREIRRVDGELVYLAPARGR
jgi:hypothetical protein